MMFNKSTEFALKTLTIMGRSQEKYFSVKKLAKEINCSQSYLSKVLQSLVDGKVLTSKTGPGYGYMLAKPAEKIKLDYIVEIIDNPGNLKRCFMGWSQCGDDNPCPFHHDYSAFRKGFLRKFRKITVAQMADGAWPQLKYT